MPEKKATYIPPEIESISISATERGGSGSCEIVGPIPPELCSDSAPTFVADPQS